MAATETPGAGVSFSTFVDEAYGLYSSTVGDGESGIRTQASSVLEGSLPLDDSGLITAGNKTAGSQRDILREFHSSVALRPYPRDDGYRYMSTSHEGDMTLGCAMVAGGPLGKTIGDTVASERGDGLTVTVQRIIARTARGDEKDHIPNLLRSKSLSKYTGNVLSHSALLGLVMSDSESTSVAEIHPGFGELLLVSALTPNVTYRGLETSVDLLPEPYSPKAGSVPPRGDIRGVLDMTAPQADPGRIILTNNPDELDGTEYDVVVVRQPRDASEITFAVGLLKPEGRLVVIPGETPRSPGGTTATIVSRPPSGFGNPDLVGIQTLAGGYVGALVYRRGEAADAGDEEPAGIPDVPHDVVGGVPFINAGGGRVPALLLAASATKDAGGECLVLKAPKHIITNGTAPFVTNATGIHTYLVETDEDITLTTAWLTSRGVRVMKADESKTLSNMIRTLTNTIVTSQKRRKKGKYSRPNAIVAYGTCPVMLTAIAEAFPDATIHVVIPPNDTVSHDSLGSLVPRGYAKIRFHPMVSGDSPTAAITSAIKASGATIVWNSTWGKHRRTSVEETPCKSVPAPAPEPVEPDPMSGSRYVTLTRRLSPTHASISVPYNLVSTSLFKMSGDKQYKDFKKYVDGIRETIANINEYLLSENFVFRLYVDDSITADTVLFSEILTLCRDAGFVEIVEYNAPLFRNPSGTGHLSTFGTLVRLMPVFRFPYSAGGEGAPGDVGIVCIRDLDIKHTAGQSYDDFFRFIRDTDLQVLAYTNGYNPHHLRKVPRNHHDAVFGTGSVSFRPKLDPALFDTFLGELLDPASHLHDTIIRPTIAESRRGKSAEGTIYYGVDELLLNHIILPQIPPEGLRKVLFYDEPYYLVGRIHDRYIEYPSESDRRTGRRRAIQSLRSMTPDAITSEIKRLVEENHERMPAHEYDHNKDYDITRTYEQIML